MSKRLYVSMVLCGALAWMGFGMWLSRVLTTRDAGNAVQPNDLFVLAAWFVLGVVDAYALLQVPIRPERRQSPGHPAL